MATRFSTLLIFAVSILLTGMWGCAVGPDYAKPKSEIPTSWQLPPDPTMNPTSEDIREWWTLFEDPVLNDLIGRSELANHDLRIAMARVKEARANLGIITGDRYPTLDATGSAKHQRTSENSTYGSGSTQNVYDIGFDASWEIDLFGRISRSVEASMADFQATEEDKNDVAISMYAEVAQTYFLIRTLQARISAAVQNIRSQQETLALTQSKYRHGLTNDLDVAQAEQILATSQASLPPLSSELTNSMYTLDVLLGYTPGTLREKISIIHPVPVPPSRIAVGIPSNIIRQRPDIRRSERQLAAATARIGVATADLYPSLSITGTFGLESVDIGDLFQAGSRAYSFGLPIRWPIFQGGKIRNNIKAADAKTEQAMLTYEKTVLSAIGETKSAMSAYAQQRAQLFALERSVSSAKRALKLAVQLYRDGLADFQSLLDAQRSLFNAEDALAEAEGNTVISLVKLYKALGGGWEPATEEQPADSAPETATETQETNA